MNAKQRQEIMNAPTKTQLTPYLNDADDHAPAPNISSKRQESPLGLQSHDTLEVLASSADIEDTDPRTHLQIQLGQRFVDGRYEVRLSYRIDEQNGEPFRAVNRHPSSAYRAAAKTIFHRMTGHGAKTYEIILFTSAKIPKGQPFETPNEEYVAIFEETLNRYIKARQSARKD